MQENEMGAQCVFGCVGVLWRMCVRLSVRKRVEHLLTFRQLVRPVHVSVFVSVCALRVPAHYGNTVT